MRTFARFSILPVVLSAAVIAGCGRQSASDVALSDDLKKDLSLASSSSLDLANKQASAAFPLTEVAPEAAPAPVKTLKKSSGPKAVHSHTPTVAAAPEPTVAPETEQPQVQTTADAPVPSTTESAEPSAPAVPRPTPVAVNMPMGGGSAGTGGRGPSDGAGAGGSVLGTIFGVVIRGGGIGDDDHCDPHGARRRGGRPGYPTRGGIYTPSTPATSVPYPMGSAGTILRRAR